jgi:hypothetical protein
MSYLRYNEINSQVFGIKFNKESYNKFYFSEIYQTIKNYLQKFGPPESFSNEQRLDFSFELQGFLELNGSEDIPLFLSNESNQNYKFDESLIEDTHLEKDLEIEENSTEDTNPLNEQQSQD